jgi:hypothetical protein
MRPILVALMLLVAVPVAAGGHKYDPFLDAPLRLPGEEPDSAEVAAARAAAGDPINLSLGLSVQGNYLVSDGASYFGDDCSQGLYFGLGTGSVSIESSGGVSGYGSATVLHAGYARKSSPNASWGLGWEIASGFASASVGNYTATASGSSMSPHGWIDVGARRGLALHLAAGTAGFGVGAQLRFGHVKGHRELKPASAAPAERKPYVQPPIYGR